jgi:hypothetical protein
VTGFATGTKGGKARVEMYFPTDPGYRDTVISSSSCFSSTLTSRLKIGEDVGGGRIGAGAAEGPNQSGRRELHSRFLSGMPFG